MCEMLDELGDKISVRLSRFHYEQRRSILSKRRAGPRALYFYDPRIPTKTKDATAQLANQSRLPCPTPPGYQPDPDTMVCQAPLCKRVEHALSG